MAVIELLDRESVHLEPVVAEVQLLDSRVVSLEPTAELQLLDKKVITLEPLPVAELRLLDTRTITLTPVVVPEEYKLIQHTIHHWAYVYDGKAEVCPFEFKLWPEQIPGAPWLGKKIANAFASKLEAEGSKLLELKVYEDTTPTFWTNYRVEVTATASPIAWALVIYAVLAILFIIAITFLVKTIHTLFFEHKPLSDEIKKTWDKETLIAVIGDFEAKLDLSPTSAEELESMSSGGLREYCDQLAEIVAPPAKPSVWPWVIAGVAGVVAVGALVARKR